MTEDSLTNLAQLRALLRETHTSGDDTMRMAGALNLINKIIQDTQANLNKTTEK